MNKNIIKARGAHPFGLTWLARRDGDHADMLMDFGVYRMKKGDVFEEGPGLEKAVLLVYGQVEFSWNGQTHTEDRPNCFDVPPTALHADREGAIRVTCLSDEAEINILRTDNDRAFGSKLYLPKDTPDEFRGAGLMRETSTRIVRTIFDYTTSATASWATRWSRFRITIPSSSSPASPIPTAPPPAMPSGISGPSAISTASPTRIRNAPSS